jgi:hypothetical protein
MDTLFLISAVLGGTIFLCQFLLGLVGLGGHHDVGGDGVDFDHDFDAADHHFGDHDTDGHDAEGAHDHDLGSESATSWFVGVLSFRTIVAGMTFFGLAGLAANAHGAHPAGSLAAAVAAGIAAIYSVAWTMRLLSRLKADGTVQIENALGSTAVVYLTVPEKQSGKGKITVTVQDRTMEYEAVTSHSALPTGMAVRIVSVVDPETVVVESVTEPVRANHE